MKHVRGDTESKSDNADPGRASHGREPALSPERGDDDLAQRPGSILPGPVEGSEAAVLADSLRYEAASLRDDPDIVGNAEILRTMGERASRLSGGHLSDLGRQAAALEWSAERAVTEATRVADLLDAAADYIERTSHDRGCAAPPTWGEGPGSHQQSHLTGPRDRP